MWVQAFPEPSYTLFSLLLQQALHPFRRSANRHSHHSPAGNVSVGCRLFPPEKRGLGYSLSMLACVTSILSPVVAGILCLKYELVAGMRQPT
ncbi:MAG: hypothetical protein ACP5JW_00955 [Candidatus Bathyarchaeia archaeon]